MSGLKALMGIALSSSQQTSKHMLRDLLAVKVYNSDLNIGGSTATGGSGTVTTDGTYQLVPFKIKEGFKSCIADMYSDRNSNPCPPSRLFEMRKLVATFGAAGGSNTQDNTNANPRAGAKVEFPLDDVGNILKTVEALKTCGAVCIDLIGEKWRVIPPVVGGKRIYTPDSTLITLKTGQKTLTVSGTFKYSSDALSDKPSIGNDALDLKSKIKFENDPTDFGILITECTDTLDTSKNCAGGIAFKHRRLIAIGTSSSGTGTGGDEEKRVFRREVPLRQSGDEITTCIAKFSSFKGIQCWAYQGESVKNVHLYL